MARKKIIWSNRAANELKNTLEYYTSRNRNANYSSKLLLQLEDLLKTLPKYETRGRLTSNKKTRVLVMKVYLIFYEISENRIEITSFWDNRQEEQKRLDI